MAKNHNFTKQFLIDWQKVTALHVQPRTNQCTSNPTLISGYTLLTLGFQTTK